MFNRDNFDINFIISVMTQVLVYCLLVSLPLLYFVFVFDINVDTTLYFLADNMLLFMIPVGLALLIVRDVSYVHQYEEFSIRSVLSVFLGCFALCFVAVWRVHGNISSATLIYSLLISLNVTLLNVLTLRHLTIPTPETRTRRIIPILYILLFIILLLSYFVRQFAADNPLSRFGLVPFLILFLPGLALVNALLPDESRIIEILVKSLPVSLGWFAILSAWSFQLGIPLTIDALYAFAALAIVIGLAIVLSRAHSRRLL